MNSSYQQLVKNLDYLKLKKMREHLDEIIEIAKSNQKSFVETLVKWTNHEIDMREKNMLKSMVKVATFPHLKEVKDFDFSFQPSVNKQQILGFSFLRFINENENIVS